MSRILLIEVVIDEFIKPWRFKLENDIIMKT